MRVLIVGAGAMGQWFADLIADWGEIGFLDVESIAAERAASKFGGTVVTKEDLNTVPIICTAVPIGDTIETIKKYGAHAQDAIIDLSGSMEEPLQVMRAHASDCERISIHPLFAPENAPGNVPIVSDSEGPTLRKLRDALNQHGYTPFLTTAEEHDRAMENVQAKVHTAVLAYALAADPVSEEFHTPVSSGMHELMEHVLGGNSRVYADIQARFEGAESVADAASHIASVDASTYAELYHDATRRHDVGTDNA